MRGEEKWRLDRTGAPAGWLGGEGFPRLEGPSRVSEDHRGACLAFRLPNWTPGSLQGSRPGLPFSGAPSGLVGPRGVGRREKGEYQEKQTWRGPLGLEDQGRCGGHFPHPLEPQECCWAPGSGPASSGALSRLVGPRSL